MIYIYMYDTNISLYNHNYVQLCVTVHNYGYNYE